MELPDELEAAIRAAPDDRAGYAVASDWLLQQGDAQGELSALSLAGDDDDLADLIIELKSRLAPVEVGGLSPLALEWRWGFIRGVMLSSIRDTGEPAMLREVLASPVARFVQKLMLLGVSRRAIEAVVEVARDEPRALGCVRSLVIHVDESNARKPIELGPLWQALPTLERVALRVDHASGSLHLPRLAELTISRHANALGLVMVSRLPALRTLRCDLFEDVALPDRWLDPARLPALRTLSITHERPLSPRTWRQAHIAKNLELFDLFSYQRGLEYRRVFVIDTPRIAQPAGLLMMAGRRRVKPGTLIPLDARFSIGRDAGNDLVLDGPELGPRQAELWRPNEHTWYVRQLGPSPVAVNGHNVGELELRSGDDLTVGHHVFRFLEGDIERLATELRTRFGL